MHLAGDVLEGRGRVRQLGLARADLSLSSPPSPFPPSPEQPALVDACLVADAPPITISPQVVLGVGTEGGTHLTGNLLEGGGRVRQLRLTRADLVDARLQLRLPVPALWNTGLWDTQSGLWNTGLWNNHQILSGLWDTGLWNNHLILSG